MTWSSIIWNGNTEHVAEHGLTPDDVDYVLANPLRHGVSRSSGEPVVFGYTPDGRYIAVIYSEVDDDTVYPITAYDIPESTR